MQRHEHMSMPMPQPSSGGHFSMNYGPPASNYGGSFSPTSNFGPTTYASNPPSFSADSIMDREMRTLIGDLKATIKDASKEDLDVLLKNEDKLNALIQETPQIKELKNRRNELISNNKTQATSNLSLQPQFEELKERLSEAILRQSSKKEEYDILKSKLETMAGSVSLDTTLALLQTSAAEKDNASEAIANELLDCKLPVDEFLDQYINERTVYHLRKIKADKMAEIVRRGPQSQQPGQYFGSSYGRY